MTSPAATSRRWTWAFLRTIGVNLAFGRARRATKEDSARRVEKFPLRPKSLLVAI